MTTLRVFHLLIVWIKASGVCRKIDIVVSATGYFNYFNVSIAIVSDILTHRIGATKWIVTILKNDNIMQRLEPWVKTRVIFNKWDRQPKEYVRRCLEFALIMRGRRDNRSN